MLLYCIGLYSDTIRSGRHVYSVYKCLFARVHYNIIIYYMFCLFIQVNAEKTKKKKRGRNNSRDGRRRRRLSIVGYFQMRIILYIMYILLTHADVLLLVYACDM